MKSETRLQSRIPADTFSARLVLMRRELGLSQREASATTGVPFGTWQGMEMGREARGLDRHVAAIALATGYDRDWLMWGGPLRSPDDPGPAAGVNARQYPYLLRLVEAVSIVETELPNALRPTG